MSLQLQIIPVWLLAQHLFLEVTQTSLAVWGDDSSTPENDGAAANESITYYLVNGDELYDVDFTLWVIGNGSSYVTSGINAGGGASVTFVCSQGHIRRHIRLYGYVCN